MHLCHGCCSGALATRDRPKTSAFNGVNLNNCARRASASYNYTDTKLVIEADFIASEVTFNVHTMIHTQNTQMHAHSHVCTTQNRSESATLAACLSFIVLPKCNCHGFLWQAQLPSMYCFHHLIQCLHHVTTCLC